MAMDKMSTGKALLWLGVGVVEFALLTLLAFLGPGSKITPKQTAKQFFTPAQYQILYAGQPRFDAQNPNPKFTLNSNQVSELRSWDLNDCVLTDGMANQDGPTGCFCENAPAVKAVFDSDWPAQPWNTWSTISLSAMGFLILTLLVFLNPPQRANLMTVSYFFALCYAYMTIALGPLSMMLHVGLRNWGGWFDSLSLYVWFGFVACYGWFRFILGRRGIAPDRCSGLAKGLFLIAWVAVIATPALLTLPTSSPWAAASVDSEFDWCTRRYWDQLEFRFDMGHRRQNMVCRGRGNIPGGVDHLGVVLQPNAAVFPEFDSRPRHLSHVVRFCGRIPL